MRVLHLFLSLILLTTTCFGQYLKPLPGMQFVNRTHRLARGLVGYWPMNERSGPTAFDLSGNGNTGTFGGTAPSWTSGKYGSAILLPGDDEHIQIADFYNTASFSVFFDVVFLDTGNSWIANKRDNVNDKQWQLVYYNGNLRVDIYDGSSTVVTFNYNWTPTVGQHYLVGFTTTGLDGGPVTLYLDSEQVASDTLSGDMKLGSRDLILGTTAWSYVQFPLFGKLSHGGIWNRILSASEIAELYREPFGMFQKDNTALIASVEAPPPPTGGQFIIIQMSMIPLFLIFTLVCLIRGKENAK